MKPETNYLIIRIVAVLGLLWFAFLAIYGVYIAPKDGRPIETIAFLDTIYTQSSHRNSFCAAYIYEVNGQTYRYEHKVTTALPRRIPMTVRYYSNRPEHASVVTNKPLLCSIGGERYYVTYISKRVVLKKAAKQFPSIVPLREPIDSIQ